MPISWTNIEYLFTNNPYRLNAGEKQKLLDDLLWELTFKHRDHCQPYKRIIEALPISLTSTGNLKDVPILPARLFKSHKFRSVSLDSIVGILSSSGTTFQVPSYIFMDKETSILQAKGFRSVISSCIGEKKLPMILIDNVSLVQNKFNLKARGVALYGMLTLSSDHLFLLDDSLNIKWKELDAFLKKYCGERIVLFGFTFMIWEHLYLPFVEKKRHLDLENSIIIHTGGWKKLEESAVNNETYKLKLSEQFGVKRIYNFYTMVEALGAVFLECEKKCLHAPDFADIIIRDLVSLEPLPKGRKGLIQVLSLLARSYPGHSVLTEDLGTVLGEDDCPCGRKGKYFQVHGRMPAAELRGCSDTYAYDYDSRKGTYGNPTT